jgi:hypothetical protein
MARITVQAVDADGEPRQWTLSERIVAANLDSDHYVAQLIERLSWATADAEALEAQSAAVAADCDGGPRRARLTIRSRAEDAPGRSRSRPVAGDSRVRT